MARASTRALLAALVGALATGTLSAADPESSGLLYSRAEAAFSQGEWRDAIDLLRQVVSSSAGSDYVGSARLRLAQAYARVGDDASARSTYAEIVAADPDGMYASQAVSMWAGLYVERYQYRETMQMCQEVMRAYPGTKSAEIANYLLGVYAASIQLYDDAARAFTGLMESHPSSVYRDSALRQLVSALVAGGRFAEAESALAKELEASPSSSSVIDQLAQVYRKRNQHGDAIRLLNQALEKRPGDIDLLESLGETYVEAGDRDSARSVWERISAHAGSNFGVHQRLGTVLRANGFLHEAESHYREALRLQPAYTYLYIQLADVHRIQGEIAQALGVYVEALLAAGSQVGARDSILDALGELYPEDRRQQAYEDARRLVDERTRGSDSLATVAVVVDAELQFYSGQIDGSLRRFRELAAMMPDGGLTLGRYGDRLIEAEDVAHATRFYETLLQAFPLAPDTSLRFSTLAGLYARQERWDAAAATYRKALAQGSDARSGLRNSVGLIEALLRGSHDSAGALIEIRLAQPKATTMSDRAALALLEAEALLASGQAQQAEDALSRADLAAREPSEMARSLLLRGDLALHRGDLPASEDFYRRAATDAPATSAARGALDRLCLVGDARASDTSLVPHYLSALRFAMRGDVAGARTAYERVVSERGDSRLADRARIALARLHERSGDHPDAVRLLEDVAHRGGPAAGDALLALAALHRSSHDTQAALDAYSRLAELLPDSAYAVEARARMRQLLPAESQP